MEEMEEGAQVTWTTLKVQKRSDQNRVVLCGTGGLVGVPGKRVEGCPLI